MAQLNQPLTYVKAVEKVPFIWDSGDLSAQCTADPQQGIYISSATYVTNPGDSGAWVRQYDGSINVKWFGAQGDDTTDDYDAFAAATNMIADWGTLEIPAGEYRLSQTWNWQNRHRSHLICRGVLKGYSSDPLSPDDYIVSLSNSVADLTCH
jgi:hypothetical protein